MRVHERKQRAEVLSLMCPYDTCCIYSGSHVDIFAGVPSRLVDNLAKELRGKGKSVTVHNEPYRVKRAEGWEPGVIG